MGEIKDKGFFVRHVYETKEGEREDVVEVFRDLTFNQVIRILASRIKVFSLKQVSLEIKDTSETTHRDVEKLLKQIKK